MLFSEDGATGVCSPRLPFHWDSPIQAAFGRTNGTHRNLLLATGWRVLAERPKGRVCPPGSCTLLAAVNTVAQFRPPVFIPAPPGWKRGCGDPVPCAPCLPSTEKAVKPSPPTASELEKPTGPAPRRRMQPSRISWAREPSARAFPKQPGSSGSEASLHRPSAALAHSRLR